MNIKISNLSFPLENTMWKAYPWNKIPKHHYDKELSFGVVAFTSDCKQVLVIRSKTNSGIKLGSPQGHANEYESDLEAAIRETFEETGVKIPLNIPVIGTVTFTYPVTYTEETLNKHVVEMQKRNERSYWNRPGTFTKTVKLFVIKMEKQQTKAEANTVICEALYLDTVTALLEMNNTKSNRLGAMIDAIKLIGGKSAIMP